MKINLDPKSILGVVASILGWVAANGATVLPTLPPEYQHVGGTIIMFAGLVLTFFAHAPTSTVEQPQPPK
jgi:hypothetical protein